MTDDSERQKEIEKFRAKRRRIVRFECCSRKFILIIFGLQEHSESDDDGDDESNTTNEKTDENLYVPLKERRRQQVNFVFEINLN